MASLGGIPGSGGLLSVGLADNTGKRTTTATRPLAIGIQPIEGFPEKSVALGCHWIPYALRLAWRWHYLDCSVELLFLCDARIKP